MTNRKDPYRHIESAYEKQLDDIDRECIDRGHDVLAFYKHAYLEAVTTHHISEILHKRSNCTVDENLASIDDFAAHCFELIDGAEGE